MLLYIQCFGLLFVIAGMENKKRKQNQVYPQEIKKEDLGI